VICRFSGGVLREIPSHMDFLMEWIFICESGIWGRNRVTKFDRRGWMITVVPRWLPQKLNYFYKCWNFQKKNSLREDCKRKWRIFWSILDFYEMEPSKLIIHLAKHVSKSFLFFWSQKSKVYQPKVKKGKNVSMGFLSNFRSDIIRLLDQCCTRPVVFLFGRNLAKISTWKIWLQLIKRIFNTQGKHANHNNLV
jgi:hypothetical protein